MAESSFDGFLEDYFAETEEHLAGARQALLALESAGRLSDEKSAINDLFRYFHSLKGISAMVELRQAESLAHHLEDYLRAVRQGEIAVAKDGIEVLIDGIQRLEMVVRASRDKTDIPGIDDLVGRIDRLTAGPALRVSNQGEADEGDAPVPGAMEERTVCTFTPTQELMARGISVDVIRKRLAKVGTIIDAVPRVEGDGRIAFDFTVATVPGAPALDALRGDGVTVEPNLQGLPSDRPASGLSDLDGVHRGTSAASHFVRVDLARLDNLMTIVGDLVISRARLNESLAPIERLIPSARWRPVQENSIAIDRYLRVLREAIMRVRLVPVGEIFRRMPFVVRDLARESGRTVSVELHGQSTEIDKYVIERMMDPVVHLVRNAVSHGIETVEERIAAGKRPEGLISLNAGTVGDIVTLEIADDGRGVEVGAVIARAKAVGLAMPAAPLDGAALLSLLCAPGFSTKKDADRASGRGVGMAVVKQTVEELAGTLELETTPGVGTKFVLHLPLTLSITDAIIGRVGTEVFAVPQGAVREVMQVAVADLRSMEENEIAPHRGAALPIVRLGRLFGIESPSSDRLHVFVVGTGGAAIGFAFDRIIGQREIVVRAINDPLVKVEGVSGATDLGDGRVVLILDPATLARLTRQRAGRALGRVAEWGRIQSRNAS